MKCGKCPGPDPPPNVEFSTFFFDGFPYPNRHIILVRAIHNTYHITASGTQLRCRGGATAARRPPRPCSGGQPPPRTRSGSPPTSCSGCTSGGTTTGTGPRVRVATVVMCHECLSSLRLSHVWFIRMLQNFKRFGDIKIVSEFEWKRERNNRENKVNFNL